MKIILATGGTGGHIYPATTLAEKLLLDDANNEIMFIGDYDHMEATEIPRLGYRFIGVNAAKFNAKKVNKLKSLRILYKSYKECINILRNFNPDVVIGFGGYVSVPAVMAASYLKIKIIIHEQNSLTGMANRLLGHFANKIIVCYKSAMEAFNPNKTVLLGNPRESIALNFVKDSHIYQQFGLDGQKKTLIIVMGSLGSVSVNQKMTAILESLKHKDYNVLYVTGKNNFDQFKDLSLETDTLKIIPYLNHYSIVGNSTLVVSRAGATSASEYTALGIPVIYVPSPFVANNHQYLNAKAYFDNGCALLLEEKDMNVNNTVSMIDELIHNDEKLADMKMKAVEMSHPNAANDIIEVIKKVCKVK